MTNLGVLILILAGTYLAVGAYADWANESVVGVGMFYRSL